MARTRNIKPSFFTNEDLAVLSPLTRLLFAGLWCHADREGRLEDRPKRLKTLILPYDDCDVDQCLDALAAAGFVARYESGAGRYISVLAFGKHQNPHVKEPASTIPAPCLSGAPAKALNHQVVNNGTGQVPGEHQTGTGNSGTSRASYPSPNHLVPSADVPQPGASSNGEPPDFQVLTHQQALRMIQIHPKPQGSIPHLTSALQLRLMGAVNPAGVLASIEAAHSAACKRQQQAPASFWPTAARWVADMDDLKGAPPARRQHDDDLY